MSLDVYLTLPESKPPFTEPKIYIRENGSTREISREEWDQRYPDRDPIVVPDSDEGEVFTANITRNLNHMAKEAGLYEALWHPERLSITTAAQLIEPLTTGLDLLKSDPDRFYSFEPENGWGTYSGLVSFVSKYLAACKQYPDAAVSVSR